MDKGYRTGRASPFRLDARVRADYGDHMTRLMLILLLLAFAAPLSGCGIKGEMKTPPPLWGDETGTETPAEGDTSNDPFADPLDENEDEDIGYGVDVADQP